MDLNKYDVYNWVIKAIKSCETKEQSVSAGKLVNNFQRMFGDCNLTGDLLLMNFLIELGRIDRV